LCISMIYHTNHIYSLTYYMTHNQDSKFYGTTTIGKRGQVVIPVKLRKELALKTGDKMLVFSKGDKMIGLVRANNIDEFIDSMTKEMNQKLQSIKKKFKTKK